MKIIKCVLCGCDCEDEWGNNPYPLSEEGRCCNNCNLLVVGERLKTTGVNEEQINMIIKTMVNQ